MQIDARVGRLQTCEKILLQTEDPNYMLHHFRRWLDDGNLLLLFYLKVHACIHGGRCPRSDSEDCLVYPQTTYPHYSNHLEERSG